MMDGIMSFRLWAIICVAGAGAGAGTGAGATAPPPPPPFPPINGRVRRGRCC